MLQHVTVEIGDSNKVVYRPFRLTTFQQGIHDLCFDLPVRKIQDEWHHKPCSSLSRESL